VDLIEESVTETQDSVSAKLATLVVRAVTTTEKPELLLTKLEQLVPLTNVPFALTERKSVVEMIVVHVTGRQESVFAKLLGMVVLAVTVLATSVPVVTISLSLLHLLVVTPSVQCALTERPNVVDPLVEIATGTPEHVFVSLDTQEELAVTTTEKSELPLTKLEQLVPLTNVPFALTRKKSVVEMIVVHVTGRLETVFAKLLGLVVLAVAVTVK